MEVVSETNQATAQPGDLTATLEDGATYQPTLLTTARRAGRKKKRKNKATKGDPAMNVVFGFETPFDSGSESTDSRSTTPRGSRSSSRTPRLSTLRPSNLTRALSVLALDQTEQEIQTTTTRSTDDNESTENEVMNEIDGAQESCEGADYHRKMNALDFEPLKCLGKGAFGTVILVRHKTTGRLYAQKQLKKVSIQEEKRLIEQTKTERAILEKVGRHSFVVKLYYAFQDDSKLYLILQYAQGGELFRHLALEKTFNEETTAFYMAEMLLALDHLHRNLGVVYRDLKPENCLLDAEGHLLLTDFGLSALVSDDDPRCSSILGTIDYMAPEVLQGKQYDRMVDYWSLGALGCDLLTGSPPFTANNHTKTQERIIHGKLILPYYLSPDAKDILIRLLRKEPRKRLGTNMPKDLSTIQSHRFFRRVDWKALQNRSCIAPIQPIITDPSAAENFAEEFTEMAISPVEQGMRSLDQKFAEFGLVGSQDELPAADTFYGFSYVASRSLLDSDEWLR